MKDKRTEKLYDSLTNVDNQFIQEISELPEIKSKRASVWKRWGTLTACLCLLIAGVCISGILPAPSDSDTQAALIREPGDIQSEGTKPSKRISISLNNITFNELSDMQVDASRLWRDPDLYEEVFWDENAVKEYYGKDLVPAYIPDGLLPGHGNGTGHAYIQKSDGKVIEDEMWLNFYHAYNDDGNPKQTEDVSAYKGLQLHASRLGILSCCLYILPENEVKTSDIGGISVTFGYRPMPYGPYDAETHEPSGFYDLYVAEFEFEGIDYRIVAEQMERNELVKVVSSIIFGEKEIIVQD